MSEASATATKPPYVPRWLVRTIWIAHRAVYSITGGRLGLRPSTSTQWGMLRLTSVGRRSGKARVAIVGFIVDGPNVVIPAMNGWADPEPAWWLNLQADPNATVELPDGRRDVTARAAVGEERDRLWGTVPRPQELGLQRGECRPAVPRDGHRRAGAADQPRVRLTPSRRRLRRGPQTQRARAGGVAGLNRDVARPSVPDDRNRRSAGAPSTSRLPRAGS